jgi:hypothetical protein
MFIGWHFNGRALFSTIAWPARRAASIDDQDLSPLIDPLTDFGIDQEYILTQLQGAQSRIPLPINRP